MYRIIVTNNNHNGYNSEIIVTSDGSVYALAIIDLAAANDFVGKYPSLQIGNNPPDFPDPLFEDFANAKVYFQSQGSNDLISEESAMALVLRKYNSGVALLKQDASGNFKRLDTIETILNTQI